MLPGGNFSIKAVCVCVFEQTANTHDFTPEVKATVDLDANGCRAAYESASDSDAKLCVST